MPDPLEPPPRTVALAAAGGGFAGAVVGVVAATMMMGSGDNGDGQARLETAPKAEIVVAKD